MIPVVAEAEFVRNVLETEKSVQELSFVVHDEPPELLRRGVITDDAQVRIAEIIWTKEGRRVSLLMVLFFGEASGFADWVVRTSLYKMFMAGAMTAWKDETDAKA